MISRSQYALLAVAVAILLSTSVHAQRKDTPAETIAIMASLDRIAAIKDPVAWASKSPRLSKGQLFASSGLASRLDWPKNAEFVAQIMTGSTPYSIEEINGTVYIMFYNPIMDVGLFASYIRNQANDFQILDAFILAGELIRDNEKVQLIPKWEIVNHFMISMPTVTKATLQTIVVHSGKGIVYDYYAKKAAGVTEDESRFLTQRIAKTIYKLASPDMPCSAAYNAALARPELLAKSVKLGNIVKHPKFWENAQPLLNAARFISDNHVIQIIAGERPSYLVALSAKKDAECNIDTAVLFDPSYMFKEFIPPEAFRDTDEQPVIPQDPRGSSAPSRPKAPPGPTSSLPQSSPAVRLADCQDQLRKASDQVDVYGTQGQAQVLLDVLCPRLKSRLGAIIRLKAIAQRCRADFAASGRAAQIQQVIDVSSSNIAITNNNFNRECRG